MSTISKQRDPFDLWSNAAIENGDMTHASTRKYASLWNTWRAWLLSHQSDWDKATAEVIQEFLAGAAPGAVKSARRPINPTKMSTYTRQRYWRLLRGVYASATRHKLIASNPALDLDETFRPSIARKDRQSQILQPFVFSALLDPKTIKIIIKTTSEDDWWHVRDRAIIAILASTGITSAELLSLTGADVTPASRIKPTANMELDFGLTRDDGAWAVDVMENSSNVGRTLRIPPQLSPFVQEWSSRRKSLLLNRSARTMTLAQRDKFMLENETNGPYFLSRRAKDSAMALPALEQVTLYYTVSQAMKALQKRLKLDSNNQETHVAKGPAVIRNSVIRRWLDTKGVDETVLLAGLKNADSLRLASQEKTLD